MFYSHYSKMMFKKDGLREFCCCTQDMKVEQSMEW